MAAAGIALTSRKTMTPPLPFLRSRVVLRARRAGAGAPSPPVTGSAPAGADAAADLDEDDLLALHARVQLDHLL
ncbi:hypothetical protein DF186_22675, partial [Enterococcus hirae]